MREVMSRPLGYWKMHRGAFRAGAGSMYATGKRGATALTLTRRTPDTAVPSVLVDLALTNTVWTHVH